MQGKDKVEWRAERMQREQEKRFLQNRGRKLRGEKGEEEIMGYKEEGMDSKGKEVEKTECRENTMERK